MNALKKILAVIAMFCAFVGAVGSFGYDLYQHEYVVAIGMFIVALMAVPTFIRLFEFVKE